MDCLLEIPQGCILNICLLADSSSNEILPNDDPRFLRIKVTAPPIDFRANKALMDFLVKKLKLRNRDLEFMHGKKSKIKQVLFKNTTKIELEKLLKPLCPN